ncbi:30S ribosomal protein S4 [bacterium]|nr:30S ribosomal protein S4 [bacterium]
MGKYLSAKCKICRRVGEKLFLKGRRCYTSKCALTKRKYPPGLHGPKGYPRLSEYGLQLREKQKIKRVYGVLEAQLKKYFRQARRKRENVAEEFLKQLEKRLDNVLYRAGFFTSRNASRQAINHSHFLVNKKKVNIPSYQVKVGEIIEVKKEEMKKKIKENISKEKQIPSWIHVDDKKLTVKIIKEPEKEDLPKEFDIDLVTAFYSR